MQNTSKFIGINHDESLENLKKRVLSVQHWRGHKELQEVKHTSDFEREKGREEKERRGAAEKREPYITGDEALPEKQDMYNLHFQINENRKNRDRRERGEYWEVFHFPVSFNSLFLPAM